MHSFSRRMPKSLHSLHRLRQNLSNVHAHACWRSPLKLQEDILEIRRFSTIVWGQIGCRQSDINCLQSERQKERYKCPMIQRVGFSSNFVWGEYLRTPRNWNMSCCPCFDSQHTRTEFFNVVASGPACVVFTGACKLDLSWQLVLWSRVADQRDVLEKKKKKRKCFPNSCDSESLDAHLILCWLIKPFEV